MSHSKQRKRGKSLYLDKWNTSAQKYIHICYLCGRKGYSPAIEAEDFTNSLENEAIFRNLTSMLRGPLSLDSLGRCDDCARRQEKDEE